MKSHLERTVAAVYDRRTIRSNWKITLSTLLAFFVVNSICTAQIQQAWVAPYNNGITNGTHQAVKMALDTNGNIYVTGFSQNTSGNLGYATIKYAPNGNQVWSARYDTTNTRSAKPAGLSLDKSNNVVITGSALTVKYDRNGNQLWTAPYAGTALAADTNANVIVTGFGTNFNTVKLSPAGSNMWSRTYTDVGPTLSQVVSTDAAGNVHVSGQDSYIWVGYYFACRLATIKWDANGNRLWTSLDASASQYGGVSVVGAAFDDKGNCIVVYNITPSQFLGYITIKYGSDDGSELWTSSYNTQYSVDIPTRTGMAYGLALGNVNDVFLTGQLFLVPPIATNQSTYGTFRLNSNGVCVWTNIYPQALTVVAVGTAMTVDNSNNVYVTGYSPGTTSGNDIVTIKYDNNGNQIWLQRYNGPGNGDDEGNAIAVDASGNVYVTGYETVAGGGTEMVTIKYAPGPFVKKEANGGFLLQAAGSAGQDFDFQASTNLQTWQDIGATNADTNGNVQFLDTNAPLFSHRFYLATPQ